MNIKTLITIDSEILSGQPVFAGTCVLVETLFDHLEAGVSLNDFCTLNKEQAIAILDAANKLLTTKNVEQLYAAIS